MSGKEIRLAKLFSRGRPVVVAPTRFTGEVLEVAEEIENKQKKVIAQIKKFKSLTKALETVGQY